jgi:hypothetical protein
LEQLRQGTVEDAADVEETCRTTLEAVHQNLKAYLTGSSAFKKLRDGATAGTVDVVKSVVKFLLDKASKKDVLPVDDVNLYRDVSQVCFSAVRGMEKGRQAHEKESSSPCRTA